MQHSKTQEPLFKYLSRYYAATTAAYARRPRHRASFVQASIPFAHSVSPWCPALYIFIFPSSLRSEQSRVQMISIIQTQPTPRLLKLLRRQALERSLRGHGHENRQRHGAMWEVQRCCSRAGRLIGIELFVSHWCFCASELSSDTVSAYVRSISLVARTSGLRWWLVGPCRFLLLAKALGRGLSADWTWWWWWAVSGV